VVEYYSGLCFLKNGNLARAEEKAAGLQSLIERHREPRYSSFCDGLRSAVYLDRGKTAESQAAFEKIFSRLRICYPRLRMLEAAICIERNDKSNALKIYDETYNFILARAPNQGGDGFDFYLERSKLDYYKARMYEHFGEKDLAIQFYEKAIFNWRNADPDYVNLIDAKERLESLRGMAGK
jgi:tetratricopeptide (TPR) repeat protein